MKTKYPIIFILGILLGSLGMYTYTNSMTNDDRLQIGDHVQTTSDWNEWYAPIEGNITDVDHYDGNTLVVIDENRSRWINEDWFKEVE